MCDRRLPIPPICPSTRGSLLAILAFASLALLPTTVSRAAGHRDWTLIPLGSLSVDYETDHLRIARQFDRFGVIPGPIVLTTMWDPHQPPVKPFVIKIFSSSRRYPDWKVERIGQTYVIGQDVLERDSIEEKRILLLTIDSSPPPPQTFSVMLSGMPDMSLAGGEALGPLEEVVARLPAGGEREYVQATLMTGGTQLELARATFGRLGRGADARLARFAREAQRRIALADAEAVVRERFADHYRLGLYAQQCGQFRVARLHFNSAVGAPDAGAAPAADRAEAWYRLGEMMERCGDDIPTVAGIFERAGAEAGNPTNTWDVLIVILRSKEYTEEREGRKVTERATMTQEQIDKIKTEWRWVDQMVYGASRGSLRLRPQFVELEDERGAAYELSAGWLYGPSDAIVPTRGTFDCVMSFHPRGPSVTGGADCGPNGAAMTDIGTWCGWEVYLHEWNHQFDWTIRASELADGYPITHHSDGCGHQPIPSMGYGHRASMHYYLSPALYRRLEVADPIDLSSRAEADPRRNGYALDWFVSDPVEVDNEAGTKELPAHHVLDFGPAAKGPDKRRRLKSAAAFVDLAGFFRDERVKLPPACVAQATTYVLCDKPQEARIWLGHNDGLALWVNRKLVHRGDYYAQAKWEDQNLTDMVATAAKLEAGWNQIDVAVEAWPAPRDRGYGFSLRIVDLENRPIEQLKFDAASAGDMGRRPYLSEPLVGKFYRWDEVRDDWTERLPRLSVEQLREYIDAGKDFAISARVDATTGFVALGAPADAGAAGRGGVPLRGVPAAWKADSDRDDVLNNVLDWNRESVAVYPFVRDGKPRHLLLIRPEAIEAYLTCLAESADAAVLYSSTPPRDRVIGYVRVGDGEFARDLLVVQAALATPLPADEEDLLRPLGG